MGSRVKGKDEEDGHDFIKFGLTSKNREIVGKLMGCLREQKFINNGPEVDELFFDGANRWEDE